MRLQFSALFVLSTGLLLSHLALANPVITYQITNNTEGELTVYCKADSNISVTEAPVLIEGGQQYVVVCNDAKVIKTGEVSHFNVYISGTGGNLAPLIWNRTAAFATPTHFEQDVLAPIPPNTPTYTVTTTCQNSSADKPENCQSFDTYDCKTYPDCRNTRTKRYRESSGDHQIVTTTLLEK